MVGSKIVVGSGTAHHRNNNPTGEFDDIIPRNRLIL